MLSRQQFATQLATSNLSALALTRPPALPLPLAVTLLAIHAVSLVLVAQLMRAPLWLPAGLIGLFALAQLAPRVRGVVQPVLLAPLFFVYGMVLVRFVWLRLLGGSIEGYFDYTLPDPRVLLHLELVLATASLYGLLILSAFVFNSRVRGIAFCALAGFLVTVAWAAAEYVGHRTFGATGSDPFAYVRMGIDLFGQATPAHRFALFPLISSRSLVWFPLLHVGYRLPFNVAGDSISVWPPWGAIPFGLAYQVGGEAALYLVNPLFSLASILAAGLLAWELTSVEGRTRRLVIAIFTACLIATSNEIVNWAGVTMVDTQALVWTTLAFVCALRIYRGGSWKWAVATGLFWGLAYLVRHTQLVILAGLAPLFLFAKMPPRARLVQLLLLCLTALAIAVPDLWYHQTYLGNWLTPESEELALFSTGAIAQSSAQVAQSLSIGAEFGWVWLFVLAGVFFYTRVERVPSVALLLWLGAALALHLPYPALRLRDLLPELVVLAFYASYGVVASVARLWQVRRQWAVLAAAAVIFLALELSAARVWHTLGRVIREPPARFGAMTQSQRAAFDEIARRTPPNAVIGATLNSGAIELYAGRNAFRPSDWCSASGCAELRGFLTLAYDRGYEIYILEDSAALARVINELRADYRLEQVTHLGVPLFADIAYSNAENPFANVENRFANAGALWKVTR